MALTITIDELLEWTAEERAKWLPWLKANPTAFDVAVQPGGRFPTVAALFAYAGRGRDAVRSFLPTLDANDAIKPRDVMMATGTYPLSPRKLLFHMALHEVVTGRRSQLRSAPPATRRPAITTCSTRRRSSRPAGSAASRREPDGRLAIRSCDLSLSGWLESAEPFIVSH